MSLLQRQQRTCYIHELRPDANSIKVSDPQECSSHKYVSPLLYTLICSHIPWCRQMGRSSRRVSLNQLAITCFHPHFTDSILCCMFHSINHNQCCQPGINGTLLRHFCRPSRLSFKKRLFIINSGQAILNKKGAINY